MNSWVASRLDEVAQILEQQGANVFRVGAYQRAASMLRGIKEPIEQLVKREGLEGLEELPGIGETLARFIHQLVMTGHPALINYARPPIG
jgi:DNA polymerase/3'-5' exonuclease PolX